MVAIKRMMLLRLTFLFVANGSICWQQKHYAVSIRFFSSRFFPQSVKLKVVRLKANCVKVHFNIYQVDIKHITSHVASITRRQVDEKWCYVLLTVWHIRKRSDFFFTCEFTLEQTCFLWFSRCACWVYGIIDWSASVLADLITCNFRSLSSSSCSANLGFMGNCRKSSPTSS